MKHIRTVIILALLSGVVAGGIYWFRRPSVEPIQIVESNVTLNGDQKKEIVDPGEGWRTVYRFRKAGGAWQVRLDEPPQGEEARPIGKILKSARAPEISVGLYLCDFGTAQAPNLGLDPEKNCSGRGKPVQAEPVGFASEQIRTGYQLVFKCQSPQAGIYLTLNSGCEQAGDRVIASVASFRTVLNP